LQQAWLTPKPRFAEVFLCLKIELFSLGNDIESQYDSRHISTAPCIEQAGLQARQQ